MTAKRKIEIFSAGCALCEDTVRLVRGLACDSCEVEVLDINDAEVARRAKVYGVTRVPSIVVNGKLADCCIGDGPNAQTLKAAGIGTPMR